MSGGGLAPRRDGQPALFADHHTVGRGSPLLPQDELRAEIGRLEHSLVTIPALEVKAALKPLLGTNKPKDVDFDARWQSLMLVAGEFPKDIAVSTVWELIQTNDWLPTAKQFRTIAIELVAPRRSALETAHAMLREHERRATEARQEAERKSSQASPELQQRLREIADRAAPDGLRPRQSPAEIEASRRRGNAAPKFYRLLDADDPAVTRCFAEYGLRKDA